MKILYFSSIRWQNIKQRPQFIAEELAENGHVVDYVCRLQLGRKRDKVTQTQTGLSIRNILVFPFALKFRFIEMINHCIVRHAVQWESYDIIIVAEPRLRGCLPEKLSCPVVYDCMDRTAEFYSGHLRKYIEEEDKKLCALADHIIVSSNNLKKIITQEYGISATAITVIKNALSNSFIAQLKSLDNDISVEERSFHLLYIGTIDFWFDWKIVTAFAQKHPDVMIHLVGPVKSVPPQVPKNIYFPGPVSNDQLVHLLAKAKILLLPFVKSKLIDCVDPIKLYEYTAVGKPVLSSFWEELSCFKNFKNIFFYHNETDFNALAEQLLRSENHPAPDIAFTAQNNWAKRAEQYQKILLNTVQSAQS